MSIWTFGLLIEENDASFVKPVDFSQKGPSVAIGSGDHVRSAADHPVHGGATAIVTVDHIAVNQTRRGRPFNRNVTTIRGKILTTPANPELT